MSAATPRPGSLGQSTAGVALVVIAAAAWSFLATSSAAMTSMQGDGMHARLAWAMMVPGAPAPYLAATALMWLVMMVAMMIPAVLPMVAVYRGIARDVRIEPAALLLASGYLAAWSAFALVAAGLQWWLHARGLLHGMSLELGTRAAAFVLGAAGLYQLTPLKAACLSHCRSPFAYFMDHWRDGYGGAFAMGARHGLFCIGCCWLLMLLMFAGGAMSVVTMAALSALIVAERLLPAGPWVARLPGLVLIALAVLVWTGA